jgi:hydrogenase maturation protein HypF
MFRIEYPFKKEILACGAQKQAGFCLTKKNCGYIFNNLGSLDEQTVFEHYQDEIKHSQKELKVKPKLIAHDLHPEYTSTKYAQDLIKGTKGLKHLAVQHHHAHIASCMGENSVKTKAISIVFDGGGWGEDGQIWGGEFFTGSIEKGFKRAAHLQYVSFPGKTAALEAWQLAGYYLYQAFGEEFFNLPIDFVRYRNRDKWQIVKPDKGNSLSSSSMVGLFDAVSALVGLRERGEYEGHGALELERIVNRSSHVAGRTYEFSIKQKEDKFIIYHEPIFRNIVEDLKKNTSKSIIAAVFHNTILEIIMQMCRKIKQKEKIRDVIITGSLFQNKQLFEQVKSLLAGDGFNVITHKHFPCNDSNVSFGQAVLADVK